MLGLTIVHVIACRDCIFECRVPVQVIDDRGMHADKIRFITAEDVVPHHHRWMRSFFRIPALFDQSNRGISCSNISRPKCHPLSR